MKNFQAHHKTIRDILDANFCYIIPRFQRMYSWSKDNAQEMWDDIMSDNELFFGSFVFNVENKEKGFVDIVDGQQRITTLNILLSVFRTKLKAIEEKNQALLIQQKLAFVSDIDDARRPRLQANESIRSLFENTIQNYDWIGDFSKKTDKQFRSIKEIYIFFENKLDDHLQTNNYIEASSILTEIRKLLKKLYESKIIWIEVVSDEDAYSIFETMNARGADLTVADLLKNYFFSKLVDNNKEQVIDIEEEWKVIDVNVADVPRLTISKFIRYYWLSKYDFVNEKNLYRKIKQSNINPETLLKELKDSSIWFSLLGSGSEEDWEVNLSDTKLKSKAIFRSIEAIRLFGTTQCYVLLLCLLRNVKKIDFNFSYIFKEIENFHFVYSAISKQPGNKVEKLYSSTAKEINLMLQNEKNKEKIVKNVQEILSDLKTKMEKPPYETFKERFMDLGYSDGKLLKYIFDRYNEYLGHKHATLTKIFDDPDYNIEHILPKEPLKWNLEKKDVINFVDSLGNIIVVDRKINGWMQNDLFSDKIEKLKESNLPLVKDFIKEYENKEWTKNLILKRQENISKIAYSEIWK